MSIRWLCYRCIVSSSDPSHQRASNNKRYFESMIEQQGGGIEDALESPAIIHRDTSSYQVSDEHQIYEALCRGENVQVGCISPCFISLRFIVIHGSIILFPL